jgi:hypothetical protein
VVGVASPSCSRSDGDSWLRNLLPDFIEPIGLASGIDGGAALLAGGDIDVEAPAVATCGSRVEALPEGLSMSEVGAAAEALARPGKWGTSRSSLDVLLRGMLGCEDLFRGGNRDCCLGDGDTVPILMFS